MNKPSQRWPNHRSRATRATLESLLHKTDLDELSMPRPVVQIFEAKKGAAGPSCDTTVKPSQKVVQLRLHMSRRGQPALLTECAILCVQASEDIAGPSQDPSMREIGCFAMRLICLILFDSYRQVGWICKLGDRKPPRQRKFERRAFQHQRLAWGFRWLSVAIGPIPIWWRKISALSPTPSQLTCTWRFKISWHR